MRDAKDTCEHCPAWSRHPSRNGKEPLVELRGDDGQPVTKDGAVQYETGDDGRFLMHGNCCLRAPMSVATPSGFMTVFPTTKSNWFCEDPDKYAMLRRMGS